VLASDQQTLADFVQRDPAPAARWPGFLQERLLFAADAAKPPAKWPGTELQESRFPFKVKGGWHATNFAIWHSGDRNLCRGRIGAAAGCQRGSTDGPGPRRVV